MEDFNWIYMIEKMQEIRLFSRTIVQRTTKLSELPGQHLDLLSHLVLHEEGMTPKCLSKIMGVNKTIISRIVDKLSQGEYLIKIPDPNDKRSYSILITDLGRAEIDKVYKFYLGPIYELRRKLGDDDFLKLIYYIEQANIKMNKDEKERLE